jgi:hypothetical protein
VAEQVVWATKRITLAVPVPSVACALEREGDGVRETPLGERAVTRLRGRQGHPRDGVRGFGGVPFRFVTKLATVCVPPPPPTLTAATFSYRNSGSGGTSPTPILTASTVIRTASAARRRP